MQIKGKLFWRKSSSKSTLRRWLALRVWKRHSPNTVLSSTTLVVNYNIISSYFLRANSKKVRIIPRPLLVFSKKAYFGEGTCTSFGTGKRSNSSNLIITPISPLHHLELSIAIVSMLGVLCQCSSVFLCVCVFFLLVTLSLFDELLDESQRRLSPF